MKKLFFTVLVLCFAASTGFAQRRGIVGLASMDIGVSMNGFKEFRPLDFTLTLGYGFNDRWFAAVPFTASNILLSPSGARNYMPDLRIGAQVGYNFIADERNTVAVTGTFSGTVYADPYKALCYDLGVMWTPTGHWRAMVRGGFRYYQSLGSGYRDYANIYIGFGFRF